MQHFYSLLLWEVLWKRLLKRNICREDRDPIKGRQMHWINREEVKFLTFCSFCWASKISAVVATVPMRSALASIRCNHFSSSKRFASYLKQKSTTNNYKLQHENQRHILPLGITKHIFKLSSSLQNTLRSLIPMLA